MHANEIQQLRDLVAAVPSLVHQPKDVPIAEEMITNIATLILDPAAETDVSSTPARPQNAGLSWDELSEPARRLYGLIVGRLDKCLESDGAGVPVLGSDVLADALQEVRLKNLRLGELLQQPYSGRVQREI